MKIPRKVISDKQLADLMKREGELFKRQTPESAKVFQRAHAVLLNGVPMPWMSDWGFTPSDFCGCRNGQPHNGYRRQHVR